MILSLHSQNENQRWVSHYLLRIYFFLLITAFKFAFKLQGFHYFTLQTFNEFDPEMILKYFDMISTYYVGEIIILPKISRYM